MATDIQDNPESSTTPQPRRAPTALIAGLVWSGAMTLLVALWLGRKYTLPAFYPILFIAVAAGFFALALWHLVTFLRKQEGSEQQLAGQIGIIGSFLAGVSIFFVISGGYFLWTYRLTALGEGIGLVLLGVIAFAASWLLTVKPNVEETSRILAYVQANANYAGKVLLALAGGLIAFYYVLFWNGLAGRHLFPELLALALVVLVLAGVGAFLFTATPPLSAITARIVVLVVGGLFGFSLFVAVVGRTVIWRDTTIFGGLAAWQGEESWRLWLCAYAGMIALAIMTGSLLLARADIRSSPVLRRVLFGFNTTVTALLLLLVLTIVNVVVYAMVPYQLDWTSSRGVYSLAESSKKLLNRLDRETTVYVILSKSRESHQELYTFLENCQAQTPKFKFKHWSPEMDQAELEKLGRRFPSVFQEAPRHGIVPRRGGLLLIYGEIPADPDKKVTHAFIDAGQIFEDDRRDAKRKDKAVTQTFKGELEVMKHISSFVAEKKSRVYVLQDNGELDINLKEPQVRGSRFSQPLADSGGARLKKYLTDENYEVVGLSFAAPGKDAKSDLVYAKEDPVSNKKTVPADAGFLIVAGPSQPMAPETLDALDRYLEKGGKLLAFLDIVTDVGNTKVVNSGLEDLLKKYGVEVTNDYLISVARRPLELAVLVPGRADNELLAAFQRKIAIVMAPRVLRPGLPGKYEAETLLEAKRFAALPPFLVESSLKALVNPQTYLEELFKAKRLEASLSRTAVPVAMAVTPMESKDKKPQIYVFGDADFISDSYLRSLDPEEQELHLDWVRSCIEYSSERPGLVGPRPRQVTNYMIKPETNYTSMGLVPGWVMALTLVGLGGGLWLVRRR